MNNLKHYGKFDLLIHWVMAFNILATLFFAFGMSSLPEQLKQSEYGAHGASVTTIAICLVIRILWRSRKGFAPLPDTMPQLQKVAAKLVHYLLYLAISFQIVVGILLASTTPTDFVASVYNINYTGFNLVAANSYDLLLSLHIGGYWLIVSLLVVHIAAALKHHFIDKDEVLTGMLPFLKKRM